MKKINKLIVMFIGISSCSSDTGIQESGKNIEEQKQTSITINKEQARMIGLETAVIEKKNLRNTIKANGVLELFSQDRAEVSPLIGGRVKSILVVEGDGVNKGQLLALIEHPDFIQMQQDYQQQLSKVEFLKFEYLRKEKLYKENVSSRKEYEEARANYKFTQATIRGMDAKLKMIGLDVKKIAEGKVFSSIPIVSPINGFVHLINVNVGEFASPQMGRNQVMFEVTDNTRLHVDLKIFEKDIYKVRIGQRIYFTVLSLSEKVFEATIDVVGKAFEENPKNVHVHADIKNPDGLLIPGAYIHGRITLDEQMVTVIAESAVFLENGKSYIFVKTIGAGDEDELTFEKTEVYTGIKDVGLIEIKNVKNFPANAEIITKGVYVLSFEMTKRTANLDD